MFEKSLTTSLLIDLTPIKQFKIPSLIACGDQKISKFNKEYRVLRTGNCHCLEDHKLPYSLGLLSNLSNHSWSYECADSFDRLSFPCYFRFPFRLDFYL